MRRHMQMDNMAGTDDRMRNHSGPGSTLSCSETERQNRDGRMARQTVRNQERIGLACQ